MDERLERVLTWTLAVALLLSLGGVVYVAATPQVTTDPYTEFYVLGEGGNASGYPTNLSVGETGTVIVGITNHEHRELTYTVLLRLGNRTVSDRAITVGNERTAEQEFSFTPETTGRMRLQILLYRGTDPDVSADPYRRLRLWITVSENGQ